jgi:UDP-3-O-[3-hydroxymyristoyl] glucosamine N-acyltransferase
MSYTVEEIANGLGLPFEGAGDIKISGVAEPAEADVDHIALAMKPDFLADLGNSKARVAMVAAGTDWQSFGLQAVLLASRPRFALSGLSAALDQGAEYPTGISQLADIHPEAEIDGDVSIGPFSVVARGARIGSGSVLGPQVYVGCGTVIGPDALIHAGVRIAHNVTIGARFVAQIGAAIGGDGFSFVTPEPSGVEVARQTLGKVGSDHEQVWARIHSLGGVTIGDDVEIGANSSIDRGTVRDTLIGSGTKLDSLVQVGHNVVTGTNCLLCAQAGVAGSTILGRNVVIGGQAGVSDNVTIGDNVILTGATKALSKVPAGRVMMGYPAVAMETHMEIYKSSRRLPRLFREVASLQKAISKLAGTE